MEVLSRNPYDLLDDEGGDTPVAKASAPKKDDKKAAPAKKDAPAKKQTERAPRNEYPRRGGLQQAAPRGGAEGGVSRQPRQNRERDSDFETPREQRVADGERRERGGFRGGRGGRGGSRGGFRGREFDRHSGSGRTDGLKKEVAGTGSWGNPLTAEEEAKVDAEPVEGAEKKEGAETPVEEEVREPEPEDSFKTLEQFLAERAKPATEAKLRKANEGADDAQWKNAVPLKKEEDEELFADLAKPGKKGKAAAAKDKTQKTFVNIDQRFADEGRNSFSPRGGRGRGEFRGGRGGDRNGASRGGRGGRQAAAGGSVSIEDQNAFPSLSSK